MGITILEKFPKDEFDFFIKLKRCLKNRCIFGSIKDSYPLPMFGYESFIKSKPNDQGLMKDL